MKAKALIKGSSKYPDVMGFAYFTEVKNKVIVSIVVKGLPVSDKNCNYGIFAVHIHEGGSCTGNSKDLFADTKSHYNPKNCPHPFHAGDMPSLFSAGGEAMLSFLTDRFNIKEIIGKTVVIHSSADDFHSQPSGNSGEKIACGVITNDYYAGEYLPCNPSQAFLKKSLAKNFNSLQS